MAIMDLYPATPGHVLVIPKSHIENIYSMPGELGRDIMAVAVKIAGAIKQGLHPIGVNLIQANEEAGGQTIAHFHLHIVPRYQGDSVVLRFGHGEKPTQAEELGAVADKIRSVLFESAP